MKPLRQVGVDRAGRVHRGRPVRDRPGAHLVRSGGQEADEPEQPVREGDDPVQAALGDAQLLGEDGRLLRVELAELHLDPGRERVHERVAVVVAGGDLDATSSAGPASSPSPTLSRTRTGFWVRKRKPRSAFSSSAIEPGVADRVAVDEADPDPLQDRPPRARSPRARPACRGDRCRGAAPGAGRPSHRSARTNSRSSCSRSRQASTDPAGCGWCGSSQARTTCSSASASRSRPRCSAGSSSVPTRPFGRCGRRRQVDVGHVGVDDLLRVEDLGEAVEADVRDLDHPDVELHPAEPAGLGVAARQRVEDGGLAGPGKPDDRDLHAVSIRRRRPPC